MRVTDLVRDAVGRTPTVAASWVFIACLCFVPGLGGPFLLDDLPNLQGIFAWADGNIPLAYVLSQGDAGPLGRPLSLLSFALTAATSGSGPLGFKVTNLAIHLANGLLAGAVLQRVFPRLPSLAGHRPRVAWLAAAAWVALPIHVPTVLYIVQRMTLLSATFSLAALLAWLLARERLEKDPGDRAATALLWLGVPLLTLLGALSKEIGLLTPVLCAVFEFTLFRALPRPRSAAWFVRIAVLLPILVAAAYLATHPGYLLGGYTERPFGFIERALSQPRALWEYVGLTIMPRADRLGLYQDTFAVSTGWLEPATTSLAIAAWLAVGVLALAGARRLPGFAAGIGFFLAAHALESSIFALEPFFIHRNYLPSLGLVIACSTLLAWAMRRISAPVRIIVIGLGVALLLATALTTGIRSWTWGNEARLMASELATNPGSLRLRSDLAARAIGTGRTTTAFQHLDAAEASAAAPERRAVGLWRILALCTAGMRTPDHVLERLRDGASHRITSYTMRALETLARHAEAGKCEPVPASAIAEAASQWFGRTPQSATAPEVWRSRYAVARLLGAANDLERAQPFAVRAFVDSGHAFPPGVLAFQLSSTLGDRETALEVYRALDRRPPGGDPREAQVLAVFRDALRQQGSWTEGRNR